MAALIVTGSSQSLLSASIIMAGFRAALPCPMLSPLLWEVFDGESYEHILRILNTLNSAYWTWLDRDHIFVTESSIHRIKGMEIWDSDDFVICRIKKWAYVTTEDDAPSYDGWSIPIDLFRKHPRTVFEARRRNIRIESQTDDGSDDSQETLILAAPAKKRKLKTKTKESTGLVDPDADSSADEWYLDS